MGSPLPHPAGGASAVAVWRAGADGPACRPDRRVARAEQRQCCTRTPPVLKRSASLWAGRRLGLPVVYEARAFWEDAAVDHGTTREGSARYRLTRALETFMFKRAAGVVVIAAAMRNELARRGVVASRVTVVPNGVDVERFRPAPRNNELARRLGLEGALVLGFIGSFYRYEGLRFLVEAMPELRKRLPQARVLLVGSGEEEAQLRALGAEVPGSVVLAGQVPHAEVRDYYSVIDIFVCPRRRMRLTELVTPLKPLEAMAMERPVLASDVEASGMIETASPLSSAAERGAPSGRGRFAAAGTGPPGSHGRAGRRRSCGTGPGGA